MNRELAATLLGCNPRSPAEVVKAAFAAAVKATHPDTGAAHNPYRLETLKRARYFMLKDAPTDCPRCLGSGWVAVGFKQERCPRGC